MNKFFYDRVICFYQVGYGRITEHFFLYLNLGKYFSFTKFQEGSIISKTEHFDLYTPSLSNFDLVSCNYLCLLNFHLLLLLNTLLPLHIPRKTSHSVVVTSTTILSPPKNLLYLLHLSFKLNLNLSIHLLNLPYISLLPLLHLHLHLHSLLSSLSKLSSPR